MICPNCGHNTAMTHAERGKRISVGLANSTEKIGRPRDVEYSKIYELRKKKMSHAKIAEELNISIGSVQHALRIQK